MGKKIIEAEDSKSELAESLPDWLVTAVDPFQEILESKGYVSGEVIPGEKLAKQEHKSSQDGLKDDEEKPFLAPCKELHAYTGCDIVRKGNVRKGRKLCIFPGHIASRNGGRIGEVEDWETDSPKIFIMFPEGPILKLQGRTVYSKGQFIFLTCSGGGVTFKDYFDSVVILSEVSFNKKDENGNEVPSQEGITEIKKVFSEKGLQLPHHGGGDLKRRVACVEPKEELFTNDIVVPAVSLDQSTYNEEEEYGSQREATEEDEEKRASTERAFRERKRVKYEEEKSDSEEEEEANDSDVSSA